MPKKSTAQRNYSKALHVANNDSIKIDLCIRHFQFGCCKAIDEHFINSTSIEMLIHPTASWLLKLIMSSNVLLFFTIRFDQKLYKMGEFILDEDFFIFNFSLLFFFCSTSSDSLKHSDNWFYTISLRQFWTAKLLEKIKWWARIHLEAETFLWNLVTAKWTHEIAAIWFQFFLLRFSFCILSINFGFRPIWKMHSHVGPEVDTFLIKILKRIFFDLGCTFSKWIKYQRPQWSAFWHFLCCVSVSV